jgi:serine phosphatase RsbU (regulator of sigma subunit)
LFHVLQKIKWGTYGGGVSRFDGKSFINYNISDGLANNDITQIVVDSEHVFLGTNDGVAIIRGFYDAASESKIIPTLNTLSNDELKKYAPAIEIFNSATGYPVKDVNVGQNCMYKDSKGIVWIATGADKTGLVRFDPSAINENHYSPLLAIEKIKINNDNICWNDLENSSLNHTKINTDSNYNTSISSPHIIEEIALMGRKLNTNEITKLNYKYGTIKFDSISKLYSVPQNLVLPYDHNNITFEFLAIETHRNFKIRYQYMLDGYDKDWSAVTDKTTATFGNIREGNYVFKLKAKNTHGIWSAPINYSFKVLPPWYRTWLAYTIYLASVSLLLYIVYRWRTASLRRDKDILEQTVKERTLELETKTVEIEKQKLVIEQKNEKITDSINYAKHIQDSLLRNEKDIQKYVPDLFIYYRPKDIVSGDFYWFSKVFNKLIIAVADCTGHGVPGAFMSMIGNILLNEIVNDLYFVDPGLILDELHKRIHDSLHQDLILDGAQDGMDISICVIDLEKNIMEFAGAQNPIYIVKEGKLEISKANMFSIGGEHYGKKKGVVQKFETHVIPIEKSMAVYMFSDGYIDQFGGDERKKIGSTRFKEILVEMASSEMSEQKEKLHHYFENWKGKNTQIDDVLVLGIKF